jgi:hypothetical protein
VHVASPAAGTLAIGCADGTVRLHESPEWADLPVLAGHVHGITAMSFDASGRWLATASRDGTARVWDLTTRSAHAVLVPGTAGRSAPGPALAGRDGPGSRGWAAAVASPEGAWHGISGHGAQAPGGGLIWLALGLARQPLPSATEAATILARPPDGKARRHSARGR